jgi:hypothetical protein
MKRTILIASLTLLASATAVADSDAPTPSEFNKLDTSQFCVYKNEVYSKGSKVKMGDEIKLCSKASFDDPLAPLRWI